MKKLSGFLDLLPEEALAKEEAISKVKGVLKTFGYVPIETPHLEYKSTLTDGSETGKELYSFTDNGGRDVGLRFDHTVPLVRFVQQYKHLLPTPFKRYVVGSVFRGERPQAGRYREFTQFDFDIVGEVSPLADAEVIQIAIDSLELLDVGDFTVRVSNRKMLEGLLEHFGLTSLTRDILRIIDKLGKVGVEKTSESLRTVGLPNDTVSYIIEFILCVANVSNLKLVLDDYVGLNPLLDEGIREVGDLLTLVNSGSCILDLSIARGLDYYTGTVFEITLDEVPEVGSICSGGSYNNLHGVVGVGASIGISRLLNTVRKVTPTRTVMLLNIDSRYTSNIIDLAKELRDSGVSVFMQTGVTSIKKQLKYANNMKYPYVIILGEDEVSANSITVKDMATGVQRSIVDIEELKGIVAYENTGNVFTE